MLAPSSSAACGESLVVGVVVMMTLTRKVFVMPAMSAVSGKFVLFITPYGMNASV